MLTIPDSPGLGIVIDPDKLAKYTDRRTADTRAVKAAG
jgi:hypothetical protein